MLLQHPDNPEMSSELISSSSHLQLSLDSPSNDPSIDISWLKANWPDPKVFTFPLWSHIRVMDRITSHMVSALDGQPHEGVLFQLPLDIRAYYRDVDTGPDGEYIPLSVQPATTARTPRERVPKQAPLKRAETEDFMTFELVTENVPRQKDAGLTWDNNTYPWCSCKRRCLTDAPVCVQSCENRAMRLECRPEYCLASDRCKNQRLQRKEFPKVEVVITEQKGFGLSAGEDIPQDSFVCEYVGEVISARNLKSRIKKYYGKKYQSHVYIMHLQSGPACQGDDYIDATEKGGLARFVNHSCNPNCVVEQWTVNDRLRMVLVARRDISTGEEVTFKYNMDFLGDDKVQHCFCQAKNCAGVIGVQGKPMKPSKAPIQERPSKKTKSDVQEKPMKPSKAPSQERPSKKTKSDVQEKPIKPSKAPSKEGPSKKTKFDASRLPSDICPGCSSNGGPGSQCRFPYLHESGKWERRRIEEPSKTPSQEGPSKKTKSDASRLPSDICPGCSSNGGPVSQCRFPYLHENGKRDRRRIEEPSKTPSQEGPSKKANSTLRYPQSIAVSGVGVIVTTAPVSNAVLHLPRKDSE